jgi:hypothetical protein
MLIGEDPSADRLWQLMYRGYLSRGREKAHASAPDVAF